MLPNQVEGAARAIRGAIKRWWARMNGTLTTGGAGNAQTLTYSVAPSAYVTGEVYRFIAGFSNTTACTLNINGLGAKNILQQGISGPAPLSGSNAIVTGNVYTVVYDGTQFQLLDGSGQIFAATVLFNTNTTVGPGTAWTGAYMDGASGQLVIAHTGTSSQTLEAFYNGNGAVGSISTSGTGTLFTTTSDYRSKTVIGPYTGALAKLLSLPVYDGYFTEDGVASRQPLMLAHEVQAIFPQAITGEKDAEDIFGEPIKQMADWSKLVPALVAALAEVNARVTDLENRT